MTLWFQTKIWFLEFDIDQGSSNLSKGHWTLWISFMMKFKIRPNYNAFLRASIIFETLLKTSRQIFCHYMTDSRKIQGRGLSLQERGLSRRIKSLRDIWNASKKPMHQDKRRDKCVGRENSDAQSCGRKFLNISQHCMNFERCCQYGIRRCSGTPDAHVRNSNSSLISISTLQSQHSNLQSQLQHFKFNFNTKTYN